MRCKGLWEVGIMRGRGLWEVEGLYSSIQI